MPDRPIGKYVGRRLYLHTDQLGDTSEQIRSFVDTAAALRNAEGNHPFNVVRLDLERQEAAFLHYPTLGEEAFPSLASSERVHVPTSHATYRSYSTSLNPPILHRTELLLPDHHPLRAALAVLTSSCEQIGLFNNPATIGFKRQWDELVRSKGYTLNGLQLTPLANDEESSAEISSGCWPEGDPVSIQRHRTALSRYSLSAPVQSLLRDGLLRKDTTFFDYGCGKGDDLATLIDSGFNCSGWDPYYRPDHDKKISDVVNIGFVINVIEDKQERAEALLGAFTLAQQVLAIAAMVSNTGPTHGRTYADGIVTSRATFQKYFTQPELQHFIESTLDDDAYAASPGVFYVFKSRTAEQSYLTERTSNRSRVAQARLIIPERPKPPRVSREIAAPDQTSAEQEHCLEQLWQLHLKLGRPPEEEEAVQIQDIKPLFGAYKRALRLCLARGNMQALDHARESRKSDLLVMFALRRFERRRKLILEERLRRDVRAFFGSAKLAETAADALLFSVRDTSLIRQDCESSSANGLGYLDAGHSLQLHSSLVERLPARLRVYIGCATALVGDIRAWDIVKAHIDSGKVTLLRFNDFAESPTPSLRTRVKVRLRDQELDIFEYGQEHTPTLLLSKSRYINEEFAEYAEQLEFDEQLERLGILNPSEHGPSSQEFRDALKAYRFEVDGFRLVRCGDIPDLRDKCGSRFTFADLVHVGDTWERIRVENKPKVAESYNALADLARCVLEPVVEYFGGIRIKYGFASANLTKHIEAGIAPRLDQHSACETKRDGVPICSRGGAAVDFIVEFEDMREVARWICAHCSFDRLYFYGSDRPIHVSVGPENMRAAYALTERGGKRFPKRTVL